MERITQHIMILLISIIAACMILVCKDCYMIHRIQLQKRQLADLLSKEKHYDSMKRQMIHLARLRHNYTNQLLCIRNLVANDAETGIREIELLLDRFSAPVKKIYTTNHAINGILAEKFQTARASCIKVHSKIRIPGPLAIPAIDLSALYGNLLDNAIEACAPLENPDACIISFFTAYCKGSLLICVKNPYHTGSKVYLDPQHPHGLGLSTVREIVDAHHGIMDIRNTGETYEVRVSLPCRIK